MGRGRLRVQKIEKELSALTSSAMEYKSFYSKSAAEMAKEAIEASECEAAESRKVRKTTIVEPSSQDISRLNSPSNLFMSCKPTQGHILYPRKQRQNRNKRTGNPTQANEHRDRAAIL